MENVFGEQTNASGTSDFVTDFLSGTQVKSMSTRDRSALPPKPAPRRRNRRPKEGQQVDENYMASHEKNKYYHTIHIKTSFSRYYIMSEIIGD